MRGNLQHRIGGGVENRLARAHMLGAELFEHGRAAARVVADELNAGFAFDCAHQFVRETSRKQRTARRGPRRRFPNARWSYPCRRSVPAFGRSSRSGHGRQLLRRLTSPGTASSATASSAKPNEHRFGSASSGLLLENMTECVRALIAVAVRVRRVPDPDAVENDQQRAH